MSSANPPIRRKWSCSTGTKTGTEIFWHDSQRESENQSKLRAGHLTHKEFQGQVPSFYPCLFLFCIWLLDVSCLTSVLVSPGGRDALDYERPLRPLSEALLMCPHDSN